MIQRRFWATLIVVIMVFGLLCGCSSVPSPGSPAVTPSPSGTVGKSVGDVVSAKAVVVPYKEAKLSFQAAGRVQQMLVSEGQAVTAGQELAKLETRDLEQAVRQAEAGLKSAQAQLAKAKAGARPEEVTLAEAAVAIAQGNLAAAQATLSSAQANLDKLLASPTERDVQIAEKQVELAKNQLWGLQKQRDVTWGVLDGQVAAAESQVAIAQLQLEKLKAGAQAEDIAMARAQVAQAQAGVQTAEAQVRQAQAQLDLVKAGNRAEDIAVAEAAVAQAEATLAEAQNALDDAVLTAPFDGTIGAILINEGERASPQVPVIDLGDLTRLRIQTEDLSEVDVSRVKVGQEVTITVDALEGKVFQGKVARIAPVATDRRGDKVYTVTLDLDAGPETGLRWGMSAFVEIKVAP
jgi:HlyD family secretion protein